MIKILIPTASDRVIPMPEYNYSPLPLSGMELQLTAYWQARIDEGAVKIAEPIINSKKSNKED